VGGRRVGNRAEFEKAGRIIQRSDQQDARRHIVACGRETAPAPEQGPASPRCITLCKKGIQRPRHIDPVTGGDIENWPMRDEATEEWKCPSDIVKFRGAPDLIRHRHSRGADPEPIDAGVRGHSATRVGKP